MRKNGFRKALFGIMSFLMFFVLINESVYADTGEEPYPSVTLEIKNAPEDYYVAILYETGEITEDRTVMNIKRTIYVILAYAFTLLIEYIVYLMFGYPNIKDNIACLVILNATTSIPLYICAAKTPRGGGPGGMLVAFLFFMTIFLEGVLYGATLKEKDGSSDTGKNFAYSVVANIVSFFLGGSILESFMTYLGL